MEARRQYDEPVHNSRAEDQYPQISSELPPSAVPSYSSEVVPMEFNTPVDQDAQQLPLLYPPDSPPLDPSQSHVDEVEDATPKVCIFVYLTYLT